MSLYQPGRERQFRKERQRGRERFTDRHTLRQRERADGKKRRCDV